MSPTDWGDRPASAAGRLAALMALAVWSGACGVPRSDVLRAERGDSNDLLPSVRCAPGRSLRSVRGGAREARFIAIEDERGHRLETAEQVDDVIETVGTEPDARALAELLHSVTPLVDRIGRAVDSIDAFRAARVAPDIGDGWLAPVRVVARESGSSADGPWRWRRVVAFDRPGPPDYTEYWEAEDGLERSGRFTFRLIREICRSHLQCPEPTTR